MDAIGQLNRALVGRYDVEREIGRGGMATVFLAHDHRHDRRVALKVLNPELGAVLGVERFLSEIKVTANLQHPNLLPLFDSGEAEGHLFYVMPFVEGESVRARLTREKQLPVDESLRLATSIAGALDHAHRHGVIHRDLKPENILLYEGQPLVADFGIALAVTSAGGKRITDSGLSVGTPQYMSPEQAAGDRVIDARADIYSLGVVLYEMLTGEPPHSATTAQALIARVLTDTPRAVRVSRPSVPEHVEWAIERALEKLPADRFATAQEFGAALVGPRGHTGAPLTSGTSGLRPARSDWRSKVALPAGVVAIVATVAAAWGWAKLGQTREGEVLHVPISLEEPSRQRYPWANGLLLSPDGKKLVYHTAGNVLYLMDLATGQNSRLQGGSDGSFAFSPASDSLVVRTGGWHGNLYQVSLSTGQRKFLTDSARNANFSWGNDGWIYHGDLYLGVSRTRSDGSRRERLARPDTGQAAWMSGSVEALPNGKGVLFARRPWLGTDIARSEIYALDLATRTAHSVARGVQARFMRTGHLLVVQADGSLLAAPFNLNSLRPTAEFVKVLDSVEVLGAPETGGSISVSEAGDLLYVTAALWEEDRVVYVDRTGRAVREDSGWGGWIDGGVAVSSDGRSRVASVMRRQRPNNLWIRGASQRNPSELTPAQGLDFKPTFFKGGSAVAFVAPRDGGNWDLYFVPVDGASAPIRVLDRPGDITRFGITPDGRAVVFCEAGKNQDLGLHRFAPDTLTTMLTATPFNECYPVLSPSGQWVAYNSNETGRLEAYVRPVRGQAPARRISTDGIRVGALHWSRDGREIFFLGVDGGIFAVPVREGATPSFGSPKRLFSTGDLVWQGTMTADDQQFLMIRQNLRAPGRVVLIRNFAKVVREKLGK